MGIFLWVVIIVLMVLGIIFIVIYNSLIRKRNTVKNAFAQIDVQLKRRHDLIPKLIDTVKGYMNYEKSVLEEVTKARTAYMQASDIKSKAQASNQVSSALKSLFAVAEKYPQLKANQNFMQLQEEISGTENKIAYSRQFYNDSVMDYNNYIQMFPSNIIASMFAFRSLDMFEAEETDKKDVNVNFE